MSNNEAQPAPTASDGPAIWPIVIEYAEGIHVPDAEVRGLLVADMAERHRIGIERYGVPLQAHNGRDALVDAYQEALDLCAYLAQAYHDGTKVVSTLFRGAVRMAHEIRVMLHMRDAR